MDRFIVGSGRCGSTLLSLMLAENPRVLSVFEFFTGLDMARRFVPHAISGEEIAYLIAQEQPFVTAVIRRGYRAEEITYPYAPYAPHANKDDDDSGEARSRHTRDDPLPWLLVSMLPRLTQDPDNLFDRLIAQARRQQDQLPAAHYRELFEWLGGELGRPLWIERSGSSIDYLGDLVAQFPDARFLHLHRDGREVALSMREHPVYRLPISFLYDVTLDSGKKVSELGAFDIYAPPGEDDPITQILASRPAPAKFGCYWSDQILHGYHALPALAPDQYREMRFEDLVARPGEGLREIADFFEIDAGDGAWVEQAAALVRGTPPSRFEKLSPAEQEELEEACRPGQVLLGRAQ
ncbi:MAG: sulfotransferase [Deltaproteobacteria bacterium]|nr:sulfotransferase [Deltaproteobacteria bacterium]